jgi:CubicO group peptidase (beta-lactamase class C family)
LITKLTEKKHRVRAPLLAGLLAAFFANVAVCAASPTQTPKETRRLTKREAQRAEVKPETVAPRLAKEDLETFLDGFVPMQLERDDIAGAVICVVKDGKVVLEKGYGFADVQNKKPVIPDATLFRPGSISKTFMWTAVMQLMEQGKIKLDRDVNDYLDFRIRPWFGVPVTMKDLMTHTPGFEESYKDLFLENASQMLPLGSYLSTHLPREIFPPGTTPAYSNYGAALAGYIVQRVSGMPFDDYIEKNIFQPLGMNHTTFRQPLPDNLAPMMSNGYDRGSGKPKGFEYVQAWPAGSVSTTADDMSHWMIAHLQNGEYEGVHVLKPETATLMHSRAWTNMPELNGGGYGFYEMSRNGRRIIGHGGDTQWFHSLMGLMLDDHVGFFVSYNSTGKGDISAPDALWEHFLDRYFPYTRPVAKRIANSDADIQTVVGTYWSSRRSQTNIAAVAAALNQPKVTANSDGTISVEGFKDFAGNLKHFEEIAPMVFRDLDGQDMVGFRKGINGRERLVLDFPFQVGQRVPAWKNGKMNLAAIEAAAGIFALTLIFWPVGILLRRHYGQRIELPTRYRGMRAWMRGVCVVDLAFLLLFTAWISSAESSLNAFSSQFDTRLHLLQVLGVIGVVGVVLSVCYFIQSWATSSLWIWTRIWNTLLMLACVAYVFFVVNWHMLNFHLNY